MLYDGTDAAGSCNPWSFVLLAAALLIVAPDAVLAQVPDEFLGKWSSDPTRCEQVNGEVDVLEVTKSNLTFYEIGCELKQPARTQDTLRFAAQCYKGGSPMSSGTVVLHRTSPDQVDLALQGFSWSSAEPEAFRRCRRSR